jgi:hypothetical protein
MADVRVIMYYGHNQFFDETFDVNLYDQETLDDYLSVDNLGLNFDEMAGEITENICEREYYRILGIEFDISNYYDDLVSKGYLDEWQRDVANTLRNNIDDLLSDIAIYEDSDADYDLDVGYAETFNVSVEVSSPELDDEDSELLSSDFIDEGDE